MLIIFRSNAAKFRPSSNPIYRFSPNMVPKHEIKIAETQTTNIGT